MPRSEEEERARVPGLKETSPRVAVKGSARHRPAGPAGLAKDDRRMHVCDVMLTACVRRERRTPVSSRRSDATRRWLLSCGRRHIRVSSEGGREARSDETMRWRSVRATRVHDEEQRRGVIEADDILK